MNKLNNAKKLIEQKFILVGECPRLAYNRNISRGSYPKGCNFSSLQSSSVIFARPKNKPAVKAGLNGGGCMAKRLQPWTCNPESWIQVPP